MKNQLFFIRKWTILCSAITLLLLQSGCVSDNAAYLPEDMPRSGDTSVRLSPGDGIKISFLGAPHLNIEQNVRRDGKMSLPLIGEVNVEGRTPAALRESLKSAYGTQLQQTEIAVEVISRSPIYVSGAVRNPGGLQLEHQISAFEAIVAAGGFVPQSAEVRTVVVIRHIDGERYGCSLDFTDTLEGKEAEPFYLEPYDIVYVPRTFISKVNQWVDQHINRLLPRFGASINPAGEVSFSR